MHRVSLVVLMVISLFGLNLFAEALIVISSDDPSMAPGAIVDSNKKVKVGKQRVVKLMRKSGTVVTIKGPYHHLPLKKLTPHEESKMLKALARLTVKGEDDISSIGTMRSGAPGSTPTDHRWINTETGELQCAFSKVQLWRYDDSKKVTIVVQKENGKKVKLVWEKGKSLLPWPKKLVLENGAYVFHKTGGGDDLSQKVKIFVAPKDFDTDYNMLFWMSTKGCSEQASIYARVVNSKVKN